MLPEQQESSYLLKTVNQRIEQKRQPECLHSLLEVQVGETPDAVAVIFEAQHLTYAELDARANQLAHHLRNLGVQRGTLVGIFAERSLEMVIALYATLKAGAAYVPIDPAYPAERVTFMLQDAQVPVLLTQAHLLARIPTYHGQIVTLEKDWAVIGKRPRTILTGHETADDLAYMIYTSGSTGQPKGVMNTHGGICNRLNWMQGAYGLQADDRVLQKTPFSFDVSVWELFWPLLVGARLVMARPGGHRDSTYLLDLIQCEGITTLHFVPSMLRSFVREPGMEVCGRVLRRVISSGEALSVDLQALFFKQLPSVALHNLYGPTEAAVDVTAWICRHDLAGTTVPIGHPITNIHICLLDAHQQLVPIRQTGELHIGGIGLARGYHRRPDLTAERFIPDPVGTSPGGRLYKTGDLVRYGSDGTLDYLGRLDHQVKIRGFRIELGEIETALLRHPAINKSVVMAWGDKSGDQRLVAYVVVAATNRPTTTDLLSWLKQTLPDYMLPSQFVFLKSLPLTPNGKIDRKALPPPDTQRPQLEAPYVSPTTPQELALAEIWSQALEVTPVGIHDNFFELGGDSIRAIQILAYAQQQGMAFTLEQLFTHQTIHNLVPQLAQDRHPVPPIGLHAPFDMISPEDHNRLPAGLEDAYPLTQLQMGMFYHIETNPTSAIFHDIFTFRIQYPFQYERLQLAVDRFIERHAPMRTSFDMGSFREPLQLVHTSVHLLIAVKDLQHLDSTAQADALDAWIADEKCRPFDPTQAPLLRILVHRYSPDEFQFIASFHHAILDGWSLAVMLTEILQDYSALLGGTTSPITPPAVPYRAYVASERAALTAEGSRQFWAEKLYDPDIHQLPRWPELYRAGGPEQMRSSEIPIPSEVFSGLKALALQAKAPLKSVLLAAHYRVMNALHGRPDVMSGIITNGRPEEIDGERMVGLFLNTVPVRLQLNGATWLELVQQTFQTERDLIPHRRFPLADIQQALGGHTLFETAFDFVHFHVYRNLDGYKDMGFMEGHYFEANSFVLLTTFMMDVTSTQLQMHIDYDPAEMCAEQIEAICRYYLNTLSSMASQPHARYDTFSPLSHQERKQQLVDWNKTTVDYPRFTCIHELFEEQVEQTPDAISIVFEDQQLTYRELNKRANQLAHYLQTLGVGPETRVGLCMETSIDLMVSLLGILKAGGAYVPLDPEYPTERLEFMLQDMAIQVLVTHSALSQRLPNPGHVICLDEIQELLKKGADENTVSRTQAGNLAYVMYTSGSTGQPKGVCVEHRAIIRLVRGTSYATFSPEDVYWHLAPLAFDASTFEIWGAMLHGARLVVLPKRRLTVEEIGGTIRQYGVTTLWMTAGLFHVMVSERIEALKPLRLLLAGGDVLSVPAVEQARRDLKSCRLINGYGPTEGTTFSCCYTVPLEGSLGDTVPIGRPIGNTTIYILDAHLQPVPICVRGELYIGGQGLARGYWNRSDLTAEKFVPHPFDHQPGARLYKTGDEARYRPDGNVEFLGRVDHQVKIRGYRIELGEIEKVLQQHPGVQKTVVLCREDSPGEKQLVAYMVPASETTCESVELRTYLKRKLPDYMLPAAFVRLDALPLTPNGKVDRQALPAPRQTEENKPTSYERPGTPLENLLVDLWTDLLKIDKIGVQDNFFALGGHSLLATQVMARLRQVLELDLPLRTLFEHPTIAQLTREIDTQLSQAFPGWHKDKPAPEWKQMGRTETVVIPHTDTERKLADIWCQLLGLERVSLHDHFFSLGGHSLLAMRLTTRIRLVFGVELPISQIFEAPKFGELAKRIDALPVGSDPFLPSPLTEQVMQATVPASYAQERMWFLQQSMPNSAVYNTSFAFRILGDLQVEALRRSLQVLEERHDPLRTTFVLLGDQVGQHVQPAREFPLPLKDVSPMPPVAREGRWQAIASQESSQLFDLSKGPLWRGRLVRLSNTEHVLLLTFHHICMDEWSLRIFREELSKLYAAFSEGKSIRLAPLPSRYVDYAQSQRQWLASSVADNQLEYWRTKLGRELSVLNLPTDYPRLSAPNERGATERRLFSSSLLERLKKLSAEQEMTLFMTLLGAFQVLLSRYSGQDDIVVGTPIANRDLSKFQGLVGLFLNTMVMRGDLSGQPTVREMLTRVRKMALEAYANRNVPFEKVVHTIRGLREGSTAPLFQIMFVLQNLEEHATNLGSLETTLLPVSTGTAKFELTLFLAAKPEGLQAVMEYRTDLFEPTTIQQMLGNLEVLLEGIVSDPEKRIGELPLLAESERHQALVEWNQTTVEYPRDKCIHQLFEAQVARTPDAVAMAFEDCHVTYRELNCRANQLASHLQKLGVGPEVRVGLYVERSVAVVVGLLGVLKAGGVYAPLDPGLPTDRLTFMLQDVKPAVVLTTQGLVNDLDGDLFQTMLLNETLASSEEVHNPFCLATPDHLAYLLFTSGSTGQPKAVAVRHQTLVNLVTWQNFQSACGAGERTLQFSALSFDVSLQEIFTALCGGGTLVLIGEETRRDLPALVCRIYEQCVTRLFLPFVLLEDVIHTFMTLDAPPTWLREIITAGEQLRITSSVPQLFEQLSHTILVNQYGPTEAHVVSHYVLDGSPSDWVLLPPIGRPIWNMQLYILDETLHPVPIGVQGELYIGGEGLARGYWNRPELTALKFVPHPFDHQPGTRLYKTGDWARYRPNGNIEFLGRRDDQVKVRGYRIELGEIEATLEQHDSVRQAIVLTRDTAQGDRQLVAYVTPTKTKAPSSGELREALATSLPDYMVPSLYVLLDAFPLTPNGKVDRRGLPAPQQIDRGQPRTYESPRTPLESLLVELWTNLLKIDEIGIHDNFFSLGGHSLLATRVVARLRTMLDLDLPVRILFEQPTVAELAMAIDLELGTTFPDWPKDDSLLS